MYCVHFILNMFPYFCWDKKSYKEIHFIWLFDSSGSGSVLIPLHFAVLSQWRQNKLITFHLDPNRPSFSHSITQSHTHPHSTVSQPHCLKTYNMLCAVHHANKMISRAHISLHKPFPMPGEGAGQNSKLKTLNILLILPLTKWLSPFPMHRPCL